MSDLFGGNFNSGDFYGMGAEDAPWYDVSQYASKLPNFSSWANAVISPSSPGVPATPAAVSTPDFDEKAVTESFLKSMQEKSPDDAALRATIMQPGFAVRLPNAISERDGPTSVGTRTANRPGSSGDFSQGAQSVATAITSILSPLIAARQQRVQTAAQRRQRVPANNASVRGSGDNTNTYLLIGGGALLLFGIIFVATKD